MTRADKLLVIAVLAAALLAAPAAGALSSPTDHVALRGPDGVTVIDATVPGRYVVNGLHGAVTFESSGGSVRAVSAECPDGLCVRMGTAAPGRPVVCAPNGISATVVASPKGALDAVSR